MHSSIARCQWWFRPQYSPSWDLVALPGEVPLPHDHTTIEAAYAAFHAEFPTMLTRNVVLLVPPAPGGRRPGGGGRASIEMVVGSTGSVGVHSLAAI